MKSPSVSITGATGFVGSHLAEAFRDAGWAVRGIVRPGSTNILPGSVERVESSLDRDALSRAVDGSSVLVHGAALVRARRASEFGEVNVGGTRAAVVAANAAGAKLLLMSSQAAVGPGTALRPRLEEDEPEPLTPYGRSKLEAEGVVRANARVPWVIARPSAVYGPRDRGFLPLFRLASRGVFPIVAGGNPAFTLIHVRDLVRALVLAVSDERAWGATMFLGYSRPQRVDELLRGLARAVGRRYRPVRIPSSLMRLAAAAGELAWMSGYQPLIDNTRLVELQAEGFVCNVDRARELIGFSAATDWPEGAEETARWYRERRWA